MTHLQYFWSYTFVQWGVWIICGGAIGILLFLGISAGVVSRRTRKRGVRGAFSVEVLNKMVASKLQSMSDGKEVSE